MSDTFDLHYGETIIKIERWISKYGQRIVFNYKGGLVDEYKKDADINYYINVVNLMCFVIDKIGKDEYNNHFKDYYHEYISLNDKYIILNDNVYEPYEDKHNIPGECIMTIQLEGEKPDSSESFNIKKTRLIDDLKFKVENHYNKCNSLPKEEYLLKKATERYNKILQWFKDNKIWDYIISHRTF